MGRRLVLALALIAACLSINAAPAKAVSGADAVALCRQVIGSAPEVGERTCRSAEQVLRGTGNSCRNLHKGDLCVLTDGRVANQAHMKAYEASWVHKALTLQRELGDNIALAEQTTLHTHNSFNAAVYAPPNLSNLDPNQVYSMYDQLRMDVRAIEMDVHWTPSLYGKVRNGMNALTLCHGEVGQGIHIGCSIDRSLESGLGELRTWLEQPQNKNDVVLLYLENNLDDNPTAHALAAKAIQKHLGSFIERPPVGKPCADLPTKITPAQIRARGHRVIIVGNCGPGAWGTWVHERGPASNWDESGSGPGNDYPGMTDCSKPHARGGFGRISRWYEDSTWLTVMAGGTRGELTTAEATAMARCGVSLVGFDQLTPQDPRLAAVVWSWAKNEPSNTTRACATSNADAKFHANGCGEQHHFACNDDFYGPVRPAVLIPPRTWWSITKATGSWTEGAAACKREFPGSHFETPRSGWENSFLRKAARNQDVWVNYTDATGRGDWRV